jgi:RNA polymerase sigma-70 factor, ECF subfamily
MPTMRPISVRTDGLISGLPDGELVRRILAGEVELFEIVMRRHNQQLYRAARAILRDETEIEDVLQQAYLNAFAHLRQFESRSQLSTWLTRIVINEASARRRRAFGMPSAQPSARQDFAREGVDMPNALETVAASLPSPEHQAYASELQRVLEGAIDTLPDAYRVVFMLRDVEGMNTSETGAARGPLRRRRGADVPVPRAALRSGRRRGHAPHCRRPRLRPVATPERQPCHRGRLVANGRVDCPRLPAHSRGIELASSFGEATVTVAHGHLSSIDRRSTPKCDSFMPR